MCSYSGCHVVLTAVLDCTKEVEKMKGQTDMWLVQFKNHETSERPAGKQCAASQATSLAVCLSFTQTRCLGLLAFQGPNPDVLITVHSTDGLLTLFPTYRNLLLPTSLSLGSSYFRFPKHVT